MKLDDLKKDWNEKISTTDSKEDIKELSTMLAQKIDTTNQQIKRRDTLEIGIALVLIPVWIIGLFFSVSTLQSIGFIVAIASCIYIPYKMIQAKQVDAPKNNSLREYLLSERQKILMQKQMLESVHWWYLTPLGLSIALISLGANVTESGFPVFTTGKVIYLIFVVVLYVGIYFMNLSASKKKFTPLLENVDNKLEDLNKHTQ